MRTVRQVDVSEDTHEDEPGRRGRFIVADVTAPLAAVAGVGIGLLVGVGLYGLELLQRDTVTVNGVENA